MPCYDNTDEILNKIKLSTLRSRLNITTRLACAYCTGLDKAGVEIPEWARTWWLEHKRKDRYRARMRTTVKTKPSEAPKAYLT